MGLKNKWDKRTHQRHHKQSKYLREDDDPRSPKTARSPVYDGYITPSSSEGRYIDNSTDSRDSRDVVVSSSSDRSDYSGYSGLSSDSSDHSISAPQMRRTRGRRYHSSDASSYPESVTSNSERDGISSSSRSSSSISTGSPISPRQLYPVYERSSHSSVSSPSNSRGTLSISEGMTGYSDESSPITRSDRMHVPPKGRHERKAESDVSVHFDRSPTYSKRPKFMALIGKGLDKVAQTVGARR
ncbi:uncharacterized protein L199_004495 [Kwoniella botswanensis]|uniref:uncharacterized protein n=1 Tax=Kwoniella botswanensis TaxID=1268659 RepID=UPI00315D47D6